MISSVKRSIGIAVVGMGWMGEVHSRSYLQIPLLFPESGLRPRLVVCADDVEHRAQAGSAKLGFERSTTDWRGVVEDPDVEVISITTPNYLHLEIARAAAEAGKHILCEKPVGRNPDETATIEAAARKAGVLSFVGYNYRWAPMVLHARQLIADGKLGEISHYRGRFFAMYASDPYSRLSWRFDKERAGYGVLSDLMSHVVDMAHHLVGPIQRVVSNRDTFTKQRPLPVPGKGTHFSLGQAGDPMGEVTNEDYTGALVEFENSAHGTFEASRTIFGPQCEMAFEVHGTHGALAWNYERMNELRYCRPADGDAPLGYATLLADEHVPYHAAFVPGGGNAIGYQELKTIEAYEFLQSVASGRQRRPGFAEALKVASVNAAMIRSWESGAWEQVTSFEK